MVAGRDRRDAGADLDHHSGALVAEDRGEQTLRVLTRQRVVVGVADAGRLDLDQHLAGAWAFEVELDDLERLFGRKRDGRAGLHGAPAYSAATSSTLARSLKLIACR